MSEQLRKFVESLALEKIGRLTLILVVAALTASATVLVERTIFQEPSTVNFPGGLTPREFLRSFEKQREALSDIGSTLKSLEKSVDKNTRAVEKMNERIDGVVMNSR